MKSEDRITTQTCIKLQDAIVENKGNEIFAIGRLDRSEKVFQIEIAARGNKNAVPLLKPFVEKGDVVIHNHPSGELQPSAQDLMAASSLGNRGIGFYIIDNQVENIVVVAEPIVRETRVLLNQEKLSLTILPQGTLARIYPEFEERPAQVSMLKMVCKCFNQASIAIAEAGTGVGKSLAYLLPVVDWVTKNKERVVISTATINLQQQLVDKDIPLVKRILNKRPKVVLVKGRGNYLCLARLKEASEEFIFFQEKNDELESIKEWSLTTKTGSKDDLSFYPSDQVWSEVCSEADLCHGLRCRKRKNCFLLKMRRQAAKAQILVANNHLLFSDLSLRISGTGFDTSAVLPPFKHIIFDEAHNIEKSATSFFSEVFSKYTLAKCLGRIYRKKKGNTYGMFFHLKKMLFVPL